MKSERFFAPYPKSTLLSYKLIRVVRSVKNSEQARTAKKYVLLAHKRFIEIRFDNDALIEQLLINLDFIINLEGSIKNGEDN